MLQCGADTLIVKSNCPFLGDIADLLDGPGQSRGEQIFPLPTSLSMFQDHSSNSLEA